MNSWRWASAQVSPALYRESAIPSLGLHSLRVEVSQQCDPARDQYYSSDSLVVMQLEATGSGTECGTEYLDRHGMRAKIWTVEQARVNSLVLASPVEIVT